MRPKSPIQKKKVNMSLSEVTVKRIDKLAKRLSLYKSAVIDRAVEDAYLKEFKK